jgi:hypothetical protein
MSGLRIFETDPDAKREEREETEYKRPEYAYQFRTGMQNARKKPVSLAKWRVLAAGPDVAQGIAELMGGEPKEFDATKEHDFEIMTTSAAVEIVLSGADAIEDKLVQWAGPGAPIHECDGVYSLLPEDKGEPCGCPATLKDRKEAHKKKKGPGPGIVVTFRLAGLGYELGVGRWIATSWLFAEEVYKVKDALDQVDGDALCRLEIELIEYTKEDGEEVSFKKPKITVLGSYNDAIAEER